MKLFYFRSKKNRAMDFYIIHGLTLIMPLADSQKKGQNLFGILVFSLQLTELNTFIIVFYWIFITH